MSAEVRIFSAAARYVQGPGALDLLGEQVALGGASCVVVIDAVMRPRLEERIIASLEAAGVNHHRFVTAEGEVTPRSIAAVVAAVDGVDLSVVVGVGGGKSIDIAKGASYTLDIPIITVPTIASNDSPASRAVAIYDEEHQLREVPLLKRNPLCVLVDTALIAAAPRRFLAAGIGDAISKHFEVQACVAVGARTIQGTRGLRVAELLADGCYRILREHAVAALDAVDRGELSPALEDTIEAVILLSGMSFENGGLSIAHAMTRGLMAVPGAAARMHGEHVAYATLVQQALAGHPDTELAELAAFLRAVDLPHSLAALATSADDATLTAIASRTMTAPHAANFVTAATEESLTAAMRRVEELG